MPKSTTNPLMLLAAARAATGIVALILPGRFTRVWVGAPELPPRTVPITRGFAVREVSLGLGLLLALRTRRYTKDWIAAAVLSDGVDVVSTLCGPIRTSRKLAVALTGLASVAYGSAALLNGETSV
jgi:hypothetical protein